MKQKQYDVLIYPEPIKMTVEAETVDQAIASAETEFYHSISRGIFEVEHSRAKLKEEDGLCVMSDT